MSNSSPADLMNSEEVSNRSSDHGLVGSLTGELAPMHVGSQRTVAYDRPRPKRKSSFMMYRASACSCPTAVVSVEGTSQSKRSVPLPCWGLAGAMIWQGTRYGRLLGVTPANMAS